MIKHGKANVDIFLDAWKQVAHYAKHDGVRSFIDLPQYPIEDVVDKNELRPNVDALLKARHLSLDTLMFYASAFSYFNDNIAAKVLEHFKAQPKVGRMVTGANLDRGRKEVLASLMLSYEGW